MQLSKNLTLKLWTSRGDRSAAWSTSARALVLEKWSSSNGSIVP